MSLDISEYELGWLVAMLESEGSFFLKRHPNYSGRGMPSITFGSTDLDVTEAVSALIGNPKVQRTQTAQGILRGWKPLYRIGRHGAPAAEIMRELLPYFGERRRSKISEILAAYEGGA